MKKTQYYLLIALLSLGLLAAVIGGIALRQQDLSDHVQFQDASRSLPLVPHYEEGTQTYYLFLPGYLTPEEIALSGSARFTAGEGSSQDTLAGMPLNQDITVTAGGKAFLLQLRQHIGVPTLHLQSDGDLLDHLHQDKGNESDVMIRMLDDDGTPLLSQVAAIHGRGNGSWSGEKRPYTLEFSDPIDLGPFHQVEKLCLLAEATDESKLRNSIAYFAGQALDIPYASPYEFVNLYCNGEYRGLYGIVTKENYKKRLEADGITAVFEITNGENRREFWTEAMNQRIHVMEGDPEAIRTHLNRLEAALLQQDWAACDSLIDIASFARKYALEEFLANYDLSFFSQYFYLDREGILHCMLPWDYDWTLGASVSCFNDRQAIDLRACRADSWYSLLLPWEDYRAELVRVLTEDFTDSYLSGLEEKMTADAIAIDSSRECDRLRWRTEAPVPEAVRSGITELSGFTGMFREYFPQRRDFLRAYFQNPEDYCQVSFVGTAFGTFFLPKGADLWEAFGSSRYLSGPSAPVWHTPGGQSPEEISLVTETIVFLDDALQESPPEEAPPSLSEKLRQYAPKLLILGAFGLCFLLAAAGEARRLCHHTRSTKKERDHNDLR